jgi:hypothetical protein
MYFPQFFHSALTLALSLLSLSAFLSAVHTECVRCNIGEKNLSEQDLRLYLAELYYVCTP